MAGFKIDLFRGTRPRLSRLKLPDGEAVTAENLKLGSGDLEPLLDLSTERTVDPSRDPGTIFLYDNDGSPVWFEWNDRVDAVLGPIKDDVLERVYYSGDTIGSDKAKLTTNVLADGGGGGPYPEDWLYLGVPAPTAAPTVGDVSLPEDVDPADRQAENFLTDEFIIDLVRYTVYPGTGTDNDTWRLNTGALGSIAFDVLLGTSFKVTEVINNNKVRLESATEPGITMRTLNADKSTVNDWHPMDEQGSTKEADFIGWRVPPGMVTTIPSHELIVGDVIVVSAINRPPEYFAALTTDHYAQDWDTEVAVNIDGTDEYQHEDERISASATSGAVQFQVTGSFYYDVDRASSVSSELEDRTYVYTYVNSFGEEGPPSPPSAVQPQLDGKSVLISDLVLPPTIGYDITKMRLYRTNSTEAGTEFQFVQEFDVATTTRDETPSAELGEVISTTTWDPPPDALRGLTALPNGMLVGFKGKQLYMCEPYFPHAWPPEYDQAVDFDIVGLAALGNSAVVLTTGWPYILTGANPRNANLKPIKVNQPCISKESIATDSDRVYYASNDGIVEITQSGLRIATEAYMDPDEWAVYDPATMIAEFYEGRYHGFWGFDASAVPALITAEVSGTIDGADEADIINGGLEVVITLTNDTLVAAGTAFDTQRQNIINGLTAATNQTLGWNNEIRDTELGVTDVVRTSDTVITVTLPAASGYAIDSTEVITVTVPNGALVTSSDDVVAGSTFSILPQEVVATVTISGSVATEAEVVAGGETVILTLTNDTWVPSGSFTDALVQELILGLRSSTDEINGWNDVVPQEIDVADVVRTSDTVVTITLDAVPAYSVTENESITSLVPHELLTTTQNVDVTSSNSIGITATGAISAIFGGTGGDGLTENEIIAGSETITIELTNDTWIAAGTGPIGTTAQSDALVQAIVAQASPTNGWNNEVSLDNTDLVRTSSTVATITLPAVATYSIADNETLSLDIPNDVLVTSTEDLTLSNTIGVTAQSPVTAVLSGTVTASIEEDVIIAGGETIILTLSNDTWKVAGTGPIGSTADTQAIIDGITSAQSELNGWNNEVRDGTLSPSDVVRTSDTVCTITLPATPLYNITATETITATVPTAAVNISAIAVVASPTFTVDVDVAATAAITGTLDESTDTQIRAGTRTIIITLTEDTWVAAGATFDAVRQDIIDGLDSASFGGSGWNNIFRDAALDVTDVVRTNATVVTITTPASSLYKAYADEVVTVTVPASALVQSTSAVVATPTIDLRDTINSKVMLGINPKSSSTTREAYVAFADDSYTSFTEYAVDTDSTSFTSRSNKVTFVEDETKWYAATTDDSDSNEITIHRSADDGDTWTQVYNSTGGSGSAKSTTDLYWHPDVDVVVAGHTGHVDTLFYSTDGGDVWNSATPFAAAGVTMDDELVFHYAGTEYLVTNQYLVATPTVEMRYMRSAQLTTPGAVTTAWTEQTLALGSITIGSGAFVAGSGNGKNFFGFVEPQGGNDYDVYLSSVPHNGTTETYIGRIEGGYSGGTLYMAASPNVILMLGNNPSRYWTVDVGSEGTPGNWDVPGFSDRISSTFVCFGVYWDQGTNGGDGLGFVAHGRNSSSGRGEMWTSYNGRSWTLQESTFLSESAYASVAFENSPDLS